MIRPLGLALALVAALAFGARPAQAATFVDDGAGLFSPSTVATLNAQLQNFTTQTGKQIVVVTVKSLDGTPIGQAAQTLFSQRSINGILILIASRDRKDIILPGAREVSSGWFTTDGIAATRTSMESSFRAGDYNGGITNAVGNLLAIYHSHVRSLAPARGGYPVAQRMPVRSSGGFTMGGIFWFLLIVFMIFMVARAVVRAISGGITRPPGTPGALAGPVPAPTAPTAPGVMPGGGMMGGGGSFWSGLLGGLGGAFIGNQLFGNQGGMGGMMGGGMPGADASGLGGVDPSAGGWGNDAGQADMGASSSGDFGGGGFGDSGGGDFGGGGDSGGW